MNEKSDQKVDNKSGFAPAMPKGSHMQCPLTNRICDGRTCAFWWIPDISKLKDINRMCLFRQALVKIAKGE